MERRAAQHEGRQYAEKLKWDPRWTSSSGFRVFYGGVNDSWFAFDHLLQDVLGTRHVAAVSFQLLYEVTAGGANGEVLSNHALFGSGIEPCNAFVVEESQWLKSERLRHHTHPAFSSAHWDQLRHMVWTFHDGQVEVLAKGISVSVVTASLTDVAQPFGDS